MEPREREDMHKAGHYEAHGETIAKFEFFDNGFNPYSRYLDVDKVDLILRKRIGNKIQYFEIQVKYGRLHDCGIKWQQKLFDYVSFRFFKPDEFINVHKDFFIAYVLVHPSEGYQKDIFIFPGQVFNTLIKQAISIKDGTSYKFHIARDKLTSRSYLWTRSNFDVLDGNTIEVTKYRRNFDLIKP